MRGYEKRRERIALEEKQGTINILDAASSELTGLGLKAKVLSGAQITVAALLYLHAIDATPA